MRRLLTLGGTSGIGKAAHVKALQTNRYVAEASYGLENFDIGRTAQLSEAIASVQPTDVIYSVGVNRLDWIRDAKWSDFSKLMNTNVWGFIETIKILDQLNFGPVNVVAVTSDAAWRPMRTSVSYCASKAALEMAVRVASREYAPRGWRINAVAPGKVAGTPMTKYVDERVPELRGWTAEEAERYELASSPLGRKIKKAEVADVVCRVLFGPDAQTGEIIAVNGGR